MYKANFLLIQNVRALLVARHANDRDLAMWCGHRPAWLSKILAGDRGIKLSDLDRIADFFGLTVSQLFAPGSSLLTERRRLQRRQVERRTGFDRRGLPRPDLHPSLVPVFGAKHKER